MTSKDGIQCKESVFDKCHTLHCQYTKPVIYHFHVIRIVEVTRVILCIVDRFRRRKEDSW